MAKPHPNIDHAKVDPERDRAANPFDHDHGLTGQSYSRERDAAMGGERPSGHSLVGDTEPQPDDASDGNADMPPDNGVRGSFDPHTGEVRGSGAGAGGGHRGEDFDTGTAGAAPEAPTAGSAPDRRG